MRSRQELAAERAARVVRQRLADDLDRLRSDAGLSNAALARAAGLPHSFLTRLLNGTARPSFETYAKLAMALGGDLTARVYPNTGPSIRDRHQVQILEGLVALIHPRWKPFTEVGVRRPARGWIDVVLHEQRERMLIASEIESSLRRIEQLVRWSTEKAASLPSWDEWQTIDQTSEVSRLLVVRWTRANRGTAAAAARQLRISYPAHPDDALESLTGTAAWPGPALIWAREVDGVYRLVAGR